jgi:hypothetical protein
MCCQVSHSLADLIGTDLPGGSYREEHGPRQVVDRDAPYTLGERPLPAEPPSVPLIR